MVLAIISHSPSEIDNAGEIHIKKFRHGVVRITSWASVTG